MPEIANFPHTVLFKHQREMLGNIAGPYKLTDFIDIDIAGVFLAIGETIPKFV